MCADRSLVFFRFPFFFFEIVLNTYFTYVHQVLSKLVSTGTFSAASLLLMVYDTGGAEKLYNFFVQPLFANNEELIEMAAAKTYGAVTDLWYVNAQACC